MNGFAGLSIHIDKTELAIGLAVVAILGTLALWKKRFATKAETWPIIAAKVENVFVVSSTRGVKGSRHEVSNAVLAYSYSIGGCFFSGKIKLMQTIVRLKSLRKS